MISMLRAYLSKIRHVSLLHGPGVGLLSALAILIMRRFIFTSAIPAGTDMLGFISRSSQYASLGGLYDAWSPESFGARRVFNFDNVLGAATLLTRSPIVTVKLLDVLALFGAGIAAYALAWSWFGRRVPATAAGILYMTSQASLTRWGSGQLNVEIIISLAPAIFLTWSLCLDRFTLRRAIGFTTIIAFGFLVRADLVLYIFPLLILYPAVALSDLRTMRRGLINIAETLAVAVPGVLLINAAWLIPLVNGYRAQYETLHQLFSIASLSGRSLNLYQNLLGFGREIGYFDFTGAETWHSYPWLPLWGYYAVASVLPLLAYSALWWYHDRRTIFLVITCVIVTFAASGSHPPSGSLYLWLVRNVPIFGNLRDPNRWLVVGAIAYALLASLTIERLSAAASGGIRRVMHVTFDRTTKALVIDAIALIIVVVAILPVLPTLVDGLRTWRVTAQQEELLGIARGSAGRGRIATVPFDQDYRFLAQGSYRGYEHDLGAESVLFTEHADIGDGSWNQRSANFVAYEATLLAAKDPAYSAMLASTGVSNLISFRYPLVARQLVNQAGGRFAQQSDASSLAWLHILQGNSAGTDYGIANAAPPLSFRRDVAVVLGGNQGIAALADYPGIRLSSWAVFTADDVITSGGFHELLNLIRRANVVLLADERPVDVAVEGTAPVLKLVGITGDPQLDRLDTNVPTDRSAQTGALDDVAVPIPQPMSSSSSDNLYLRRSRTLQIWARVLASPQAATIVTHVDGMTVGSVTPVTLGVGGFEWVRVGTVHVGPGAHKVTLSAESSKFGDSYEVEEARLLEPQALASSELELDRALRASISKLAYDFDLQNVTKWAPLLHQVRPESLASTSSNEWGVPPGSNSTINPAMAPNGQAASEVSVHSHRSIFSFAEIRYRRLRNWSDRPYIYLSVKGTASGRTYQVVFSSGGGSSNEALYTFSDNSKYWRTLAFPIAEPGNEIGRMRWSHVLSVRIALPSKFATGRLEITAPRPSDRVHEVAVPLPVLGKPGMPVAAHLKSRCVGSARKVTVGWQAARHVLLIPVATANSSCRILLRPTSGFHQLPAVAVRVMRVGTGRWSYAFSARDPGVLVWTQSYDPLWRVVGHGDQLTSLPVLSLVNGYLLPPGAHRGLIVFAGEATAIAGITVTVSSVVLLIALAIVFRDNRGRRRRQLRQAAEAFNASARYGQSWKWPVRVIGMLLLAGGSALIGLCPAVAYVGHANLIIPISYAALVACGVASLAVAAGTSNAVQTIPDGCGASVKADSAEIADEFVRLPEDPQQVATHAGGQHRESQMLSDEPDT